MPPLRKTEATDSPRSRAFLEKNCFSRGESLRGNSLLRRFSRVFRGRPISGVNVYAFTPWVKKYKGKVQLFAEKELQYAILIALAFPRPWAMKTVSTSQGGRPRARLHGCRPSCG